MANLSGKSILDTGFAPINLSSFQRLLYDEEQRRLMLIEKYNKQDSPLECTPSSSLTSTSIETSNTSSNTISTQSEQVSIDFEKNILQTQLKYLMGTAKNADQSEEEAFDMKKWWNTKEVGRKDSDNLITGKTVAMQNAQKYLRIHKIFEFFQFSITHLLSARADNPIEFLLELFDRCIMYRENCGTMAPPLLYQKPHLEELFKMMDRMNTGFIDIEQYKTGMNTLGIHVFNDKPNVSKDRMVSKHTFIQEAYEMQITLLNQMINCYDKNSLDDPEQSEITCTYDFGDQ